MRKTVLRMLLILTFAGTVFGSEPLTAGFAVVDITPPPGYRMSGYFYERLSTATHDPLHSRALVFKQGQEYGAVVLCDLIGVPVDATRPAREEAANQTGIPVENILIAATHSHTGPAYFGARFVHFKEQAIAEHGTDPHETTSYVETLTENLVSVIVQADTNRTPVAVRAGMTIQDGLAFNRRFHMTDGSVRFNPGKQNPDIVRPAGPTDPSVPMILVRPENGGGPEILLTSFALHLDTVGGTEYAADYPYYIQRVLYEKHTETQLMFAIGTAGDINHIDVSTKAPQKGHEEAQRIGDTLGATIIDALDSLQPITNPSFAVRTETVSLPLQQYSEEEIANAMANRDNVANDKIPFLERVRVYKIVDLQLRGGKSIDADVQAFRLGSDFAIVGLPGEVFVDLGLAIKEASPFTTTLIVTLANDYAGYVPTRKAFGEGSYETVNSRVQPGGGEALVDAALRLLKALAE